MKNQLRIICLCILIEGMIDLINSQSNKLRIILAWTLISITLVLQLIDQLSKGRNQLMITVGFIISLLYVECKLNDTLGSQSIYQWLIIILFQLELYHDLGQSTYLKFYYLIMYAYIYLRMLFFCTQHDWLSLTQKSIHHLLLSSYLILWHKKVRASVYQSERSLRIIPSTQSDVNIQVKSLLNDTEKRNYTTIVQRISSDIQLKYNIEPISSEPFHNLEPQVSSQDELIHCLPYGLILLDKDYKIVKCNVKSEVYLSSSNKTEMLHNLNLILSEFLKIQYSRNVHTNSDWVNASQVGQKKRKSFMQNKSIFFQTDQFHQDIPANRRSTTKDLEKTLQKGRFRSQKCVHLPTDKSTQRKRPISIYKQSLNDLDASPLRAIFSRSSASSHRVLPKIFAENKKLNQSFTANSESQQMSKIFVKLLVRGKEKTFLLKFLDVELDNVQQFLIIMENITDKEKLKTLQSKFTFQNSIINSFSHELKTPINQSLQLLSSLTTLVPQNLNEQYLNPAIIANKRLLHQINDIIDYKNIECNNFQINLSEFTFQSMVTEIQELFTLECEQKEIKLTIQCDMDESPITNDFCRILQVVVNLITNSIKFTRQKGELRCRISKIYGTDMKLYSISVWDNGVGISQNHLASIQHEMNKHSYHIDEDINNTVFIGLGLTVSNKIAQQICEIQQNELTIFSKENIFTMVSFFVENYNKDDYLVPSDREQQIQLIYKSEGVQHQNIKCKCNQILICDDVAFNHLALQALLKMMNLTADSAYDGTQAVDKVQQKLTASVKHGCASQYKIILMDIEMPGKDGFQTTKDVDQQNIFQIFSLFEKRGQKVLTNILMCSAYSGQQMLKKAKQSGMVDVLSKPIQVPELKRILNLYYNQN